LLQKLRIVAGFGGIHVSVAVKYFSKNVSAAKSPYPSDWLEWALHCVLGEVPVPVQRSELGVEIIQKKALHYCTFRDASLTLMR